MNISCSDIYLNTKPVANSFCSLHIFRSLEWTWVLPWVCVLHYPPPILAKNHVHVLNFKRVHFSWSPSESLNLCVLQECVKFSDCILHNFDTLTNTAKNRCTQNKTWYIVFLCIQYIETISKEGSIKIVHFVTLEVEIPLLRCGHIDHNVSILIKQTHKTLLVQSWYSKD